MCHTYNVFPVLSMMCEEVVSDAEFYNAAV